MKKFMNSIALLAFIFIMMFIINMVVMYVLFDIKVLNPGYTRQNGMKTARGGNDELLVQVPEVKAAENIALKEENRDHQIETGTMPEFDGVASGHYYMTSEEISFLGQLCLKDKLSAMTILTKLGTEEMDRIYEMACDGVTMAEFSYINETIENKLKVSDVEALKNILYRNKMLYAENGR